MTKFERVLSDKKIKEIAEILGLQGGIDGVVIPLARAVEHAVLAKQAEQEPVAWTSAEIISGPSFVDDDDYAVMYRTKSHLLDDFCGYPEATPVPLYTHPIPCVSPVSDKPSCGSQNTKYETQIPEGYQLVPIEPTENQIISAMEASLLGRPSVDDDTYVMSIIEAYLSAVPKYTGESK